MQVELIQFLNLNEKFWKQKAGMAWFKDGDRNTKLFHNHVKGRRRRLQLKRIQNSEGNWIEGNEQLVEEAFKFFQDQFREDIIPTFFGIIDHVHSMVSMEQNQDLVKQPSKEEVKNAVFGLNGDSAGGPDGFTGKFTVGIS